MRVDSLLASGELPPGRYALKIDGSSMEPTWRHGESVPVVIPAGAWRFGDVLLMPHESGPFLHRYVGRARGLLRTKGDGRGHFDGWLTPPDRVLGRVASDRPGADRLAGLWSAFCGHLYRIAYRLDRGPGGAAEGGYRQDVEALNRAGFGVIHRLVRTGGASVPE